MKRTVATAALALSALVVALAQPAPAAPAKTPSHALARLSGSSDDTAGYHDGLWTFGRSANAYFSTGKKYWYENWARPDQYGTAAVGSKLVVPTVRSGRLRVVTYDPATKKITTATSAALPTDFPTTSTPVVGPDGSITLLVSRTNEKELKGFVVARLLRFGADLQQTAGIDVRSDVVESGFKRVDASAPSILLAGSTVLVHLGREQFKTGDGYNHQLNATLRFDLTAGTVASVPGPYSSHSFAQLVRASGTRTVYVDHGDAYPRDVQVGTVAGQLASKDGSGSVSAWSVLRLSGPTGSNYTGATVNDLEVEGNRALVTGVSLPQKRTLKGVTGYGPTMNLVPNAYLVSTDVRTRKTTFRWLTEYSPRSTDVRIGQPRIVPLGSQRFAVVFTYRRGKTFNTRYRLVDQNGKVLATASWASRNLEPLSDPVKLGSRIYWVAGQRSGPAGHYVVGLDVGNKSRPRLLLR